MTQLTIEIPDALARRLAWFASAQNLEETYERFFQQSGLFVERRAAEQPRDQAVSEERLQALAAKLGAAGPLSEVIVAERGRN
jgi:hypothetical protein